MQSVFDTALSSQLIPFWVFLLMFLIERNLLWLDKYHPLSLVTLLADRMAKKVLFPQRQSNKQQIISGSLAIVVLLMPVLVFIGVFIYLSEYPIFFEAVMLLIALKFKNIVSQTKKITHYVQQNKKNLARQAVSEICLRETDKMSSMGLIKANVESLLLRFSYQYCTVFFWYLILGGPGALIYRILYEYSLVWNNKLTPFRYFGIPIRLVVNIMQWVPVKLAGMSVLIAVNIRLGISALIQKLSYQNDHLFVMNVCGASLGVELGGPAYYNSRKMRVSKCGGKRQIILADNMRTLSAVNRAMWIWLTFYFIGSALGFYFASH